ncbi:uncharacterized protein LOC122643875 [Telopea speciosissima]|uniref:uncharacterized protein LOC122643875 n=1 Tax=Telopea speciosissima TaxID=54955 RepID=UPI001CC35D06|nr:uncharacterized protein LOC122643875 [Telopea speciosissima]
MREAILKNKKRRMENLDVGGGDFHVEGSEERHIESDLGGGESSLIPSSGTASKKNKVVIQMTVKQQVRGPMDAHVKRRTPEEVVAERHGKGPQQTTMENCMRSEEERDKLRSYFARWAFESGVPFNALKLRSFEELVETIGQYGPGFKPPSFHDYRVPLLKSEKEKVDEIKKKHKISWRKGCTLMSDGWTDRKGRHLINFLVNCTEGTFFLGSVDASSQIQDAKMLFELLYSRIEEIGEENVVQVVTDNASNYVVVGRLLMGKRKKLYWTPCAAHCLDLMMEEIGNIKIYKSVILKGRKITTFIYRHARLLEAMRVQTKRADLDCLRASLPLLQVLSIVDGDERPALPEVYVAMEEAKKHIISNFKGIERKWKKIVKIIDRRWTSQMERPIYLAAFLFNPSKYFKAIEMESDESLANSLMHKANDAFNDVLVRMVLDTTLQDKISEQSVAYTGTRGSFAKDMAIRQRDKNSTPELTKLARRLLGLCCSSSGCERNWSIFEFIHTKKRNRLEHQRLNDLVYIQYNRRLQVRFQERKEQSKNYDPLELDELDWSSEWMTGASDDELVHPGDDLT